MLPGRRPRSRPSRSLRATTTAPVRVPPVSAASSRASRSASSLLRRNALGEVGEIGGTPPCPCRGVGGPKGRPAPARRAGQVTWVVVGRVEPEPAGERDGPKDEVLGQLDRDLEGPGDLPGGPPLQPSEQ